MVEYSTIRTNFFIFYFLFLKMLIGWYEYDYDYDSEIERARAKVGGFFFFFFCRLDFLRSLFCFHFPSNGRLIQFFKRALWFACVTKPNNAMLTILIAVHFDPPLFLSIFLSILSFFHFFFWGKFGEDSFFCLS